MQSFSSKKKQVCFSVKVKPSPHFASMGHTSLQDSDLFHNYYQQKYVRQMENC